MELETVEQIVALLSSHDVSEITLERDGLRITARKPLSPAPPVAQVLRVMDAASEDAIAEEVSLEEEPMPPMPQVLTAGMVGLFRHSDPPLGYGALVAPGQIVGSIEAMKILNDVRADLAGQVVDVLAEEGSPVEYGQGLFRLMPQ